MQRIDIVWNMHENYLHSGMAAELAIHRNEKHVYVSNMSTEAIVDLGGYYRINIIAYLIKHPSLSI